MATGMIKSMTGYGRAQKILNGRDITVEMKAVNHRFFEFSARVPRNWGFLEEKLKTFVGASVSRGKVEVFVNVIRTNCADTQIRVNEDLVQSYVNALRSLAQPLELKDDLSLSVVARLPDIFVVQKAEEDAQQVWDDVSIVAKDALSSFLSMRAQEGERLHADLLSKLDTIEGFVSDVEQRSPKTVAAYRERLFQKMSDLLKDRTVDEARILTEAGIFADRVAVDEETVRLRTHIAQFRRFLDTETPAGRKLDFLLQEMNREVNTIGSKAQDAPGAGIVVELKSEIEKIREQIQNIE